MKMACFGAADKKLLREKRIVGPMPWVVTIMMFLTVLSTAAGLGLKKVEARLKGGDRIIIQIIEADKANQESQASAILAVLNNQPGVLSVRRIKQEDMRALLKPWLGNSSLESDIPIPAMIEVDLSIEGESRFKQIRADILRVAPSTRVDSNADWLAPLQSLIRAMRWLAMALVLLIAGATVSMIVLATRAVFDTHRATIELLHMMGSTDSQIARLFQRRIAVDALIGGVIGFSVAMGILWVMGGKVDALGSDLIDSVALTTSSWLVLCALPAGGIVLAILVARTTIMRALYKFV